MKIKMLLLVAPLLWLTACGPEGTSNSSVSAPEISGLVLTDEGPVTKARIEAHDSKGVTLAKADMNGDGHYRIKLPAGVGYPVVLSAYPEGVTAPLKAVVTSDLVTEQDISEVSTLVVDTALGLGGITEANLAKAARAAISQRKTSNGSGTSAGFKGDPTKQYGGWH